MDAKGFESSITIFGHRETGSGVDDKGMSHHMLYLVIKREGERDRKWDGCQGVESSGTILGDGVGKSQSLGGRKWANTKGMTHRLSYLEREEVGKRQRDESSIFF